MALEVAQFIHQLVPVNPDGDNDPKSQGDDHLHLIKQTLQNTFPAVLGAVTASHTEMNYLTGTSSLVLQTNQKNVANGVAGLDSAARILNAQMPTDPSFVTARLTSTVATDLASAGQAIQIGASTAANLAVSAAIIQARSNGSAAPISINPYGGPTSINKISGADATAVYGLYTVLAAAGGTVVILRNTLDGAPALGVAQNVRQIFQNSSGVQVGQFGFASSVNLSLINQNNGGALLLQQTNAGGNTETVLQSNANGNTNLFAQGAHRGGVQPNGLYAIGSLAGGIGGAHTASLEIFDSSVASRGLLGYLATNAMYLRTNNVGAGSVIIDGRNAADSAYNEMFEGSPNGAAKLFYTGVEKLATASTGINVAGTLEASTGLKINGVAVPAVEFYDSGEISITATFGTPTHTLSGVPHGYHAVLRCKVSDLNWDPGDEVALPITSSTSTGAGFELGASATQFKWGRNSSVQLITASTLNSPPGNILLSAWRLVIRAWRFNF